MPLLFIAGCGLLQTRPGHPDSYQDTDEYNKLKEEEWKTTSKDYYKAYGSEPNHGEQLGPPEDTITDLTDVPLKIWQARGVAWNMSLKYEAAADHAQTIADLSTVPIFGAAFAAVGLTAAHAASGTVGGAALVGTGFGAIVSYAHPEQDAQTDLQAREGLLCVVNETELLTGAHIAILINDKSALEAALNQLDIQSADLSILEDPSAEAKKLKEVIGDVQKSAKTTLDTLTSEINAYGTLPIKMSTAITSIDGAARSGSRNSNSYESLVQSLEASAATKSSKDNAKTQLAAAKAKIPPTTESLGGPKSTKSENAIAKVLSVHVEHEARTIPQSIQKLADKQPADKQPTDATMNANPASPSSQVQVAAANLSNLMRNSNTSILNLVILAADQAIQDIPDPNFSAIGASVAGCADPVKPSKSQK